MCKTMSGRGPIREIDIFVHLGINHVILVYIVGILCNKLSEIDENTLPEYWVVYRVYQLKIQKMYIEYIYIQNNSKIQTSYNSYLKENWNLVNELIKDLQPISRVDKDINSIYMLLMRIFNIFINCKDKPVEQLDLQLEKICLEVMNNIFLNDKYEVFYEYLDSINWWEGSRPFTNHEVCDKMFKNAFQGKSKVFIQMPDLREREFSEYDKYTDNQKSILLQCSLLTLPMLHYDRMMLSAIQEEIEEIEGMAFYRPYFFSFIAEINRNEFQILQNIQNKISSNNKVKDEDSYIWMECTFVLDERFDSNSGYSPNNIPDNILYYYTGDTPYFRLNGYVIQGVNPVEKIEKPLYILSGTEISHDDIELIANTYNITRDCKHDEEFNQLIKDKIGNRMLSSVSAYRIGNGNCMFVKIGDDGEGFFYDIGFNCKHRPRDLEKWGYNYSDSMEKIIQNKPSFFILSHWDLDHILGISAAGKEYFDVDWFAPECQDACIDAKRLARYLDYKNRLFRVERKNTSKSGRLIGEPIEVNGQVAEYKLYMGEKSGYDSSYSNCEGIVIEYTDLKRGKGKVILMMGDVNYASFDKARENEGELKIADSQIDYLIVPHHGSQHTAYENLIKDEAIHKGKLAVICCTNDNTINRPNKDHLKKLKKRFSDVRTTEEADKDECCIIIPL